MRTLTLAVLAALSVGAVAAAELPSAPPEEVGLSSERLKRITDVFAADAKAGKIAGAVILVAREGKVAYFQAIGQRDPKTGAPMTTDAIFRIYSMTKPITSLAIMMLVEEGKLLLSDRVSRFLPALKSLEVGEVHRDGAGQATLVRTAARREMTIQDLLRHTSGLTYGSFGDSLVKRAYRDAGVGRRTESNAELVDKLATVPLASHPGSVWEYSVSTDVLGRVVEVVSGMSLGDFFEQRILSPLRMVDTGFHVPLAKHGRIAEPGPDPATGTVPTLLDPRTPAKYQSGGGGMVSTAADYFRIAQLFLDGGALGVVRLVAPKTMALMTADHVGGIDRGAAYSPGPGYGFGLGFAVRTDPGLAPYPGSVGDYHWSGLGGTTFWVDPEERLVAIMMLQAPNQRVHYRQVLRHLVYGALVN
ncbi:MAG: serine hydrolase domain-containing protein [Alphaproteobacteria bacterium]